MKTPNHIESAIAHVTEEIRTLEQTAGQLDLLRYRQQATATGIHLGTHSKDQLQGIVDQINAAIVARDALPTKRASLKMLQDELEDYNAGQRRSAIHERIALFDKLSKDYASQSQALLELFRTLHQLAVDIEHSSGQRLLSEHAYLLHLPATVGQYDSVSFRTGEIVRGNPIRPTAIKAA